MLAHTSNQGSPGASKMAQLVKGLASKSADLRLIPETDTVVGTDSGKMSSDLHTIAEVCVRTRTNKHMHDLSVNATQRGMAHQCT